MDYKQAIETATTLTIEYTPKALLAILTLIVGLKLIKILTKLIHKSLHKNKVDPSLLSFLESFLGIGLKILLFISIASMLGIETASFITLIGAAGLAVGLSLQGSLSNLAGGVLILIFKPFQVGDLIEAQDYKGRVKKIQIFSTQLTTLDNKRIIIPNGNLSNDSIKNYSAEEKIRVELNIGISYDSSIDKAKQTISQIISQNAKCLKTPEPFIGVASLGDSSVNLSVHVWTKTENYIPLPFELRESIKKEFDKQNINMPFPTRTIHLHKS
jgi:small conductance mechanosensitive channel